MFVRLTRLIMVEAGNGVGAMEYPSGSVFMARYEGGGVICRTPEMGVFDLELEDGEYEVVGERATL